MPRQTRIIAVFGGSDDPVHLGLARELGEAIAAARQWPLSGGTGPGHDSVKDCAILGARPSPWIGVGRDKTTTCWESPDAKQGFVITSALGHKRNYLEASMCDAAIALPGGDGTLSEAASSLSLGRPVAFVGDEWKKDDAYLDGPDLGRALKAMAERTAKRFAKSPVGHALDPLLEPAAFHSTLAGRRLVYWYFDANTTATAIVDSILQHTPTDALDGSFPNVDDAHDTVKRAYERWLENHVP